MVDPDYKEILTAQRSKMITNRNKYQDQADSALRMVAKVKKEIVECNEMADLAELGEQLVRFTNAHITMTKEALHLTNEIKKTAEWKI